MFSADYTIYPEIGLVYYQVQGKPELAKVIELYDTICSDPKFDVNYNGIGDWREAQSNMSRDEVIELAEYVKKHQLSNGHWVALVDSPMVTALAAIYSKIVEPQHPMDACSTVERASEILKIDLASYIKETENSISRFTI